MVNQNNNLHPAFPFVGLFAIKKRRVFIGTDSSQADCEGSQDENGKRSTVKVFLLLHEQICPIGEKH
jgi:hypothetical protein